MTHRERIETYLREGRTVSGGKGSQTDRTAAHSELSFMTTLQNAFKMQFANQAKVLSYLQGRFTSMAENPAGFSPETLAAMKSQAINQNAADVQNAQRSAQQIAASHGGTGLPSGVQAQISGQIASSGANALSGNLNQIAIENGMLQNQNYWKAVQGLGGIASEFNPLGYAGGSSSTANALTGLSEASTAADKSGFLGAFSNSLGGALGNTLGGGNFNINKSV